MITIARLRSSQTPSKRKAAAVQTSVFAHRLFPGLCALWFAALFGLGALVASGEALGALVMHLHLPAILPAAPPPLGLTARLVLGLGFAGLGGAIGLAIGVVLSIRTGGVKPDRPIRAAAAPARQDQPAIRPDRVGALRVRNRDAHPDAPPRRPLVVTEDVLPYPTAMIEPAPAPEPEASDEAAEPLAPVEAADDDFTFAWAPHHDAPGADLPPFLAAAFSSVRNNDAPMFVAPAEPIIVPVAQDVVAPEPEAAEPEPAAIAPAAAPANPPPLASLAAAAPKVALVDLPLDSLGLVQLIERLALAIATRQAQRTAAPDPSDAVDLRKPLHRFDPLTMDPAGPLLRAKKTRVDAWDEAVADHSDAGGDDDHAPIAAQGPRLHDPLATIAAWPDDHDSQALPARFLGHTPGEPHGAGDRAVVEHRYSSLTDMALPRPELVPFDTAETRLSAPVDDEPAGVAPGAPDPVVPFPSRLSAADAAAHPAPSNDADRALREALATLRQMSAQR